MGKGGRPMLAHRRRLIDAGLRYWQARRFSPEEANQLASLNADVRDMILRSSKLPRKRFNTTALQRDKAVCLRAITLKAAEIMERMTGEPCWPMDEAILRESSSKVVVV